MIRALLHHLKKTIVQNKVTISKKVANKLPPKPCTKASKHDIMHSAKLKTMCSADKDFAMQIYQKRLMAQGFWTKAFHLEAMAKAPEALR